MNSQWTFVGKGCCMALATLFLLTGCASKYGSQITEVVYYPQCYSPIAELRADESKYRSTVGTSTVVGALLGALGGYLATGNTKGTLVGAAAGGAAGAATGYVAAESQERSATNKRMAEYMQELDGDISNLNAIKASAKMTLQCYNKEFKQTVAAYKGKRISRSELDARYVEIRNGSTEAANILGETINATMEKEQQYQAVIAEQTALETGEPRSNAEPTVVTASSAPSKKSPARNSKSKPQSTKVTASKPTDAPVSQETKQLADRTQKLTQERESLQAVSSDVSRMQSSWAAELAAIES